MMFKCLLLLNLILLIYKLDRSNATLPDKNCLKRQCFEKLGCFSAQSFIDEVKELLTSSTKIVDSVKTLLTLKQLLSICPISPEVMNVTFLLFTKQSKESLIFGYNPTDDELRSSAFSSKRRTVMIIHGYTDSYKECMGDDCQWMATMKNYFVSKDYNVVAVDWSKPALDLNYFNSAFNTQIVGSIIAFFIKRLVEVFDTKPESFHLIGHSLGAHASGFTAKRFNSSNKIGHISGLDPAGPGFSRNRLSPDDANLVIIIHTSAGVLKDVDENIGENPVETVQLSGTLGCPDPLGHFDFWPNGGLIFDFFDSNKIDFECEGNGQPGCEKLTKEFFGDVISGGLSGIKDRGGCSHNRATLLPTASLNSDDECQMIGYQCDNYEDFNDGKCADCGEDGIKCKPLEFNLKFWTNTDNWRNGLKTFPNNFYFKTSESDPFCLFHYQIVVSVEDSSDAGQIKIKLIGKKEVEVNYKKPVLGFKSGQDYTQLYTDTENWGQITEAMVTFDNNILGKLRKFSKKLNPLRSRQQYSIKINKLSIKFMSNIDDGIRQKYSSQLYPDFESNENEVDNYVTFRLKK